MPKIYVSLSTLTTFADAPFANNEFDGPIVAGVISSDLLDDTASSTGVSLHVVNDFGSTIASGADPTANAGEFNPKSLRTYWATPVSGASKVELRGLPSGVTYDIDLIGHVLNVGRHTDFTVDGVTKSYTTSADNAAPNAPVNFTGTLSGTTLPIDLTAVSGELYGYINGFILEYTAGATTYTIDSIDGDNDVQAGQSNVDIVMSEVTGVTSVTLGGETLTINGVT